jgi:hypothetical protein
MSGACSTHGRQEKYKILFGKPEVKRALGRPKSRWEGNIGVYLGETGWEGVD